MQVREAYGDGRFGLSFELYPPKSPVGEATLFRHLDELMTFAPSFVTCTYGAGGSTRHKTLEVIQRSSAAAWLLLALAISTVGQLRSCNRAFRHGIVALHNPAEEISANPADSRQWLVA